MAHPNITVTVAKSRNNDSGAFVMNFDDAEVYSMLNSDPEKAIDVTQPQSPDLLWTLVANSRGGCNIDPSELTDHHSYLEHRYNYTNHLHSLGISVQPHTLEGLGSLNTFTPSHSEIFFMVDECIYDLAKTENLKGNISICRAGFAKICLNYTPEHLVGVEKCKDAVIRDIHAGHLCADTHIIINTLNSDLNFEPTYEVFFNKQVTQGKLFSDNDFFKFVSVVDEALKQCFFHLLRFAQLELHKSSEDFSNQILPPEIRKTHYICNKEQATEYVSSYTTQLTRFLNENPQYRACWIPVSFEELSQGGNKAKTVRIFAFRPHSKAGILVKPLMFVDFNPDDLGTPPPFTKEVQAMLDSGNGEQFTQNDDEEKLIEQITLNALPTEDKCNSKYRSRPLLELLHYWFIGLYDEK